MNIVLFSHPAFMASQSMPRFTRMLRDAYLARGHQVQVWSPQALCHRWVPAGRWSKWAGYVDQYLVFPHSVRKRLRACAEDTLFVFCDQALGPWVPLVASRPHVVHVHDLLALRSALGDVPENPTSWTGRIYQRYIRQGFRRARHFISISAKTRQDLHQFGRVAPVTSEVVYNGLNHPFAPLPAHEAAIALHRAGLQVPAAGMLVHVSSNDWYKNVPGVVRIYAHYARSTASPMPLWLVGNIEPLSLRAVLDEVPAQGEVRFVRGLDNLALQATYSIARALLFPSLAEGFGWPIIEAQACGCPVLTTDAAPMNEVGGPVSRYLPRLSRGDDVQAWAGHGALVLSELLASAAAEPQETVARCIAWSGRFGAAAAIDGYLRVYQEVLAREQSVADSLAA
jgi:glycosyltransferase involved in cell wall biosynthesis